MKAHYIVKNGNRETGEMSVFEAVEVLKNFKALSDEKDRLEIHSFCRKWAIKESGKVNQRRVFDSEEKADAEFWKIKPNFIDKPIEVVEVREFFIWYRIHDDKDFQEFYTDTPDLSEAVEEAINHVRGAVFAIDYDGEVVSRYGENFIKEPEKRR